MATVTFASPFQVLTRPCTLKAKDRKPPAGGPALSVAAVHAGPAGDDATLKNLINGIGLNDPDKDGLQEQDTAGAHMWRGDAVPGLTLEFELAEARPVDCLEVWNYNVPWRTAEGLRKADIAVSPDGSSWQTVAQGVQFAEADGTDDYDEPTLVKLGGATARKVRFENMVPGAQNGRIGLSKVVFHGPAAAKSGN